MSRREREVTELEQRVADALLEEGDLAPRVTAAIVTAASEGQTFEQALDAGIRALQTQIHYEPLLPRQSWTFSWYTRAFQPAPVRWWHRLLGVRPGEEAWRRIALTTPMTEREAKLLAELVSRWLKAPQSLTMSPGLHSLRDMGTSTDPWGVQLEAPGRPTNYVSISTPAPTPGEAK